MFDTLFIIAMAITPVAIVVALYAYIFTKIFDKIDEMRISIEKLDEQINEVERKIYLI